jgi:CRISPR-associated exonuclease Cas4
MFDVAVPLGVLYYAKSHRRKDVPLDTELRRETVSAIDRMRALLLAELTPPPQYRAAKCDACSLFHECMPERLGQGGSGGDFLAELLRS